MHTRMDAAGAVGANNASTAPRKTAQHAVSHSAHTHQSFHALHTKFRTVSSVVTEPATRNLKLKTTNHEPITKNQKHLGTARLSERGKAGHHIPSL
jgi:hypothetical protein